MRKRVIAGGFERVYSKFESYIEKIESVIEKLRVTLKGLRRRVIVLIFVRAKRKFCRGRRFF